MGFFDILGPIIGGLFDSGGQKDTNVANAVEAQKNRAFQRQMSNTAFRRSMRDMEKGGLNPMLAYMKGGASTPSGAQATFQNPNQRAAQHVANAISAVRTRAEIKNIEAQTALTSEKLETERTIQAANTANSALSAQRTITEGVNQRLLGANTALATQKTETERFTTRNTEAMLQKIASEGEAAYYKISVAEAEALAASLQRKVDEGNLGETLAYLRRLGVNPGSLGSVILDLVPGKKAFTLGKMLVESKSPKHIMRGK